MHLKDNIQLKDYCTMRLGGAANYMGEANTIEELHEYISWANKTNTRYVTIGAGSNIIWRDEGFEGIVILNKITGFSQRQIGGTTDTLFTFGAGENWDETVRRTVDKGYSGLELLSLIPGTCGAAPVQNIGAYGAELKDVLVSVRAYDAEQDDFVTLTNEQCGFGYRTSIFKHGAKDRYTIVSITVKLTDESPRPPFYTALQEYMNQYGIKSYTPLIIRNAVIAIRASKLPDPKYVANTGSFFTNPFVEKQQADILLSQYTDMPHWHQSNGKTKLSAAWLIEQSGYSKGYKDQETGMGLWKNHTLVLVNENARSTDDLMRFRQKLITAVKNKFGVQLEQEPEIVT